MKEHEKNMKEHERRKETKKTRGKKEKRVHVQVRTWHRFDPSEGDSKSEPEQTVPGFRVLQFSRSANLIFLGLNLRFLLTVLVLKNQFLGPSRGAL